MENEGQKGSSFFEELGFTQSIDFLKAEIQELYTADEVPWVIGYSGGKDSTAIVQLIWCAIQDLPSEMRAKKIHVISTDTLVENPIVALWVNQSLVKMQRAATEQELPFVPHRLTPKIPDTFWVNLIGKGYPSPRQKFRWCTERLKISPSHNFICDVVHDNGEAILVLGTRKAESSARAHNMAQHEKHAIRDRLTPNSSMVNSLVYTPIESWSNDDVWTYLMQQQNPWNNDNKELLTMYRGASADGECPLVVDTDTPSCGKSRFGCWVCTLVEEDKSMAAMIQNDEEKEWMLPLLELRKEFEYMGPEARQLDRSRRDYRRRTGHLSSYTDKDGNFQLVPGPYKQDTRAYFLRRILQTQKILQEIGPNAIKDLELITLPELQEIRRIWISEKHEIEDLVVSIFEEETGKQYPFESYDDNVIFNNEMLAILKDICDPDELHYELIRNLLDIERRYSTMTSRRGLYEDIDSEIKKCFYDGAEDALKRAKKKSKAKNNIPIKAIRDNSEKTLFTLDEVGS